MARRIQFGRKLSNNRKENGGRAVRKQYIPLYNIEKREELANQWREEGVPSYEIERRFRRMKLILHI